MRKFRGLRIVLFVIGLLLFLTGLVPVEASSANISHSYKVDTSIADGSLVSLDTSRSDYVQVANLDNGQSLLGVAVASNDSLLAVNPIPGAVQVATNGTANVLVSTVNGQISVGDQISVSPFNGLGMKATPGLHIIGLAQTSFNGGTNGSTQQSVTDKNGKVSQVNVGYIRLTISIGTASTNANSANLNSLQKLAKSLTGHTISTPRVVISTVVAVLALVSLITLIYASIYGSIISIGRNPLAKYAIFRSLSSVLGIAFLTALIAFVTIFFLLR